MATFTTIYSGSSGNCAYVEEDGRFLLVDMGKSARLTSAGIKQLGAEVCRLSGILITHEHSDHVGGLKIFLKQHKVPVYGSAATLDVLASCDMVPPDAELVEIDGRQEDIDGFGVVSFETSHDSVACRGYRITTAAGKTVSLATDLGFVSEEVLANLYLSDVVSLEANYDLHMLMTGNYPYYLKTRIASKRGHLCNDESAETLVRLLQAGCEKFALCHLSQENNTPECVMNSVRTTLLAHGVQPSKDCIVQPALRHAVSPVILF